jgi:hypothetical protein
MDNTTQMLLEAYARAGIIEGDSLEEHADKLRKHLAPKVEKVERTEEMLAVEITSSVDASLFDGLTCGNRHLTEYTYPDGKMSGLTRIGHCDLTVSSLYEGATLTEISKVRLTQVVLPGDTVRITIRKIRDREVRGGMLTWSSLEGCLAESGEEIFEPCQVTTFKSSASKR